MSAAGTTVALVSLLVCGGAGYQLPDFSALSGEPTAADLQTLARYPLNGTDLSACGCCEEDNMVRHARELKKINPRVQVVAYMNSVISYPWYRAAAKLVTNSSWWLRDVNGSLLNNIRENPTETWFTWDFARPEVGDLWIDACLNMTRTGAIDGCFMDGCANWNTGSNGVITVPGPLAPDVHDAYRANKPDWMRRLQQQVPGVLICGSNGGFLDGVGATQVQNWGVHSPDYAGHWIPMLQAAMAAGKVFEAHAARFARGTNVTFDTRTNNGTISWGKQ
eukprot:gene26466-37836_t